MRRAPFTALAPLIRTDDRIVITGASGWLGRSLLHELSAALADRFDDTVLALGARPRTVTLLDGRPVPVGAWNEADVTAWRPTVAVHLAYLTADRLAAAGGEEAYIRLNDDLTRRAAALRRTPTLRTFVASSSGAATVAGTDSALGRHPYSRMRLAEENDLLAASDVPTLIARAWSVSGGYCNRPKSFAFSDFVTSAIDTGQVVVRAPGVVLRRYVDAGEYLAVALAEALSGRTGVLDSTGELVEIRQLAHAVADELGGSVVEAAPDPAVPVDRYASDDPTMAACATARGLTLSTLREQIIRTARGLRP